MGKRVRKKYTLKLPSAVKLQWSLATSVGKKKKADASCTRCLQLSCSVQLLRCSSQAGITQGQWAWTDRACAGSQRGIRVSKHCVPNRACARRAGLALQDRSSPGLSQQYPSNTSTPHTCACSTRIPLLPKGSRERQIFPHLHPEAGLEVDRLRTAHSRTVLCPQGLKS